MDALFPTDDPAPARRAVIHATMTALISLVALFHRPPLLDLAVGVPFAATIAALALALGVVLFVAPPQRPAHRPIVHRAWAFLLPTGLLTLLIGFTGALTLHSGLMLAAEGGAILLVCLGPPSRPVFSLDSPQRGLEPGAQKSGGPLAVAQTILALALAVIAAWGMVQGAAGLAIHSAMFRPGVAAVLVLGPAIVLPMIPPLATLAERGRRDEAITAIVGFSLINLCVVLPVVIVAGQLIQRLAATTQPSADLPFPILVWRLDTVLLSTIGLLLLPTAIGRWTLSRIEGLALIGLYVIYLFLTLLISHG